MADLEFLLQLNAKFDEVTKMVTKLSETQGALKKTDEETQKTGKAMTFLKSTLANFTAQAAIGALKMAAGAAIDFGRQALQAAGEAERLRMSFNLLAGEEDGTKTLDFLDALASKTEFTDGQLKQFGAELLKAGFSGEAFTRAMAASTDIAAMSTNKIEGLSSAVSMLSRINLKGGIGDRELQRLGINAAGFYAQVGKSMGISSKEAEKRLASGAIKSTEIIEQFYSALSQKTGKALGGAGEAMEATFTSRIDKVRDIVPNLMEELEKAGGMKSITGAMGKLVEAFDPGSPMGKRIVAGLTRMMDGIGKVFASIDFDKWTGRLVAVMDVIPSVVSGIGAVFNAVAVGFEYLTLFGEFLGESLFNLIQWGTSVRDWLNSLPQRLIEGAIDIGRSIVDGIKQGLLAGYEAVTGAIDSLADGVVGRFKSLLGIASPSAVFADFGVQTSAGFNLGIEDSMADVQGTMAAAFAPASMLGTIPTGEDLGMALAPPVIVPPALPDLSSLPVPGMGPINPTINVAGGGGGGINATINVSIGAGAPSNAQEVATSTADAIRAALASLLEQNHAEVGA
jgi:hypothetical protein